jgi:hypothetical protein
MPWRRDFERSIGATLDYLDTRPEIDRDRIGIIGRSPAFYAPKVAAIDTRIKAAVAWGAMYHLRNLASIPAVTRDGFLFVSGSKTVVEALRFFECINLEGTASQIRCPHVPAARAITLATQPACRRSRWPVETSSGRTAPLLPIARIAAGDVVSLRRCNT